MSFPREWRGSFLVIQRRLETFTLRMRYLPPLVTLRLPLHSRWESLAVPLTRTRLCEFPKGMERLLLVIQRRLVAFTLRMRYLPPLATLRLPLHSRRESLAVPLTRARLCEFPKGMENLLLVILRRLVAFTLRMRYLPPLVTTTPLLRS